jgi:hypothetical protein
MTEELENQYKTTEVLENQYKTTEELENQYTPPSMPRCPDAL